MNSAATIYEVSEGIATITLNRPDKLNAWTPTMDQEVFAALTAAEADDGVRVIIFTGAGRGFCAGADISNLGDITGETLSPKKLEQLEGDLFPQRDRPRAAPDWSKTYSYFCSIEKPILAAINGPAVGLGFVLSLYCDIRVASQRARFSTAFSRRGLIAEYGVSWMLPRLVGVSNALDLLYSARLIEAEEALRMGLVSRVVPEESLAETVRDYARELATQVSPRSLRIIKRQVYEALVQSLADATDLANEELIASLNCGDFREGVSHFVEKRPPKFTGT